MTRMFSPFAAVIGAALVLAVPAFGQGQPDAFERAVASKIATDASQTIYADAFERAAAAQQEATSFPPDAVERMLQNRSGWVTLTSLQDHGTRMASTDFARTPSIATSGRDVEWQELGIGFGAGVLLALGLVLGLRAVRIRPLAH